jgi:hypothetical protein
MNKKQKLFTFGYTLFQKGMDINLERMFRTLQEYKVTHLIDVRSIPFSKQFPQCNTNYLKEVAKSFGIPYGHIPELGAKASPMQDVFSKASEIFFENIFPIARSNRPEKTELYADDMIVDFRKFRNDEYFSDGIKRIEKAYEQNCTIAIMCNEKEPLNCHRYFLASKAIEKKNGDWIEVEHIVQKEKVNELTLISNQELDKQLSEIILSKKEIKKMEIFDTYIFEPDNPAIIENYYGNTQEDKINDFCDRYWNLMHGWKMQNNNNYNNINDHD